MSTLKEPVRADDHIKGPPEAPVTLVEYGDYECAHCGGRGRDGHCWPPPAQIPACGATAPGSRMIDEKPLFWPRMPDARIRQVAIGDYLHSRPCEPVLMSPPPYGVAPKNRSM